MGSANRLTALPPGISSWAELQTLNASNNVLERLPDAIAKLTKLRKLVLSCNRLAILPSCLSELALTELKCDGNLLLVLPDIFGGAMIDGLEELDVSGNRLETLPDSLCRLRSLTRLLLPSNKLKSLPLQSSNGGLCRLQHVDAADNGI